MLNFLKSKPKEEKTVPEKKEIKTEEDYQSTFSVVKQHDIVQLPDLDKKTGLNIVYPLLEPYAYSHIYWDSKENELVYELQEPVLTEEEKKTLENLENGLGELINISFINVNKEGKVIEYLEKNLRVLIDEYKIKVSDESFLKIMYYIYRDFVGLNAIEPLMNDYFIEDVECNGIGSPIYIIHRKYRNLRTSITFKDIKELTSFVEKLAQKCGKYISYANPLLDGALPDGSRVNATYSEDISSKGPTFTIRKFTKEPWTPIKLMDFRTVSPEILAYLWMLVEYEKNIMIIGGTGSGKTSFLNAVAFFIPPASRIVSIEDTKELSLLHQNWLPSISREGVGLANMVGQKHGEVSLFDLLKESFRQRPDYIIVGEIRGKEAFVLFQGAASGHPAMSTMHAESVETLIRRLETEPINLSPALVETLDAVVVMDQTKVGDKVVRRIRDISEVVKVSDELGKANINVPFVRDPATDKFLYRSQSKVLEDISKQHGIPMEKIYAEFNARARLLMMMYKDKIFGFKEVQDIISRYYKNPEQVLSRFGIRL